MEHELSMHSGAAAESPWSLPGLMTVAFGLLLFTVALYWRTLLSNFVYDDWVVLDELATSGTLDSILRHFDPRGALTYRPLAWLYFAAIYGLFGLSPLGFHIIALLLHAVNGALVAWIGTQIAGKKTTGIIAGGIFIALVSLQLDCFMWLVGIYDVGAMTFGLLSLSVLMRGHLKSSAALMLCALLMKEAAVFLPLLFVCWTLLAKRPLRDLASHAALMAVYACMKLLGASPFAAPRDSGHAMAASCSILAGHGAEYLKWLASAFAPVIESNIPEGPGILLILLVICGWGISRHHKPAKVPLSRLLLLLVWILSALAPVLLLKNQSARYYAVHALVPTALLVAILLVEITTLLAPRRAAIIAGFAVGVFAVANALYVERMFSLGLRQVIVNDGYFHLIKRAAAVDAIHDSLMARQGRLPPGTTVIVDGVPPDALGGSRALRLWFRDTTLSLRRGGPPQEEEELSDPARRQGPVIFIDLRSASTPMP